VLPSQGPVLAAVRGHIEHADATVALAAQREAREESGIADLALLSAEIIDLDRHDLHGGFSCRPLGRRIRRRGTAERLRSP
jgi:8-oxo-dGTP pyrophosphatase MutT (NUDIX family)